MATTDTLDGVQEKSAPETTTSRLEVEVDRDALLRELTAIRQVVETKTTIPILANVLFEAGGDRLSVCATNLDRTVQAGCTASVKSFGRTTAPARKLYDYVKLLAPGKVKIGEQDNGWLHIRSGRSNTKMVGMNAKNFPQMPEFSGEAIALPSDTLVTLIDKASYAISEEESRYTLKMALLVLEGSTITLVATDGHRLVHVSAPSSADWKETTIGIPGDALDVLRQLILAADGKPWASMGQDANSLYFFVGERILTARKLTGQFPNYKQVIPKVEGEGLALEPASTLAALKRAMTFADARTGAVRLKITANELIFESKSVDMGEALESLDILGGTDVTAGFNGGYIADFLSAVDGPFHLHITKPDAPAVFIERLDSGLEYQYVLMPMRV